jgi:hypothetical protein
VFEQLGQGDVVPLVKAVEQVVALAHEVVHLVGIGLPCHGFRVGPRPGRRWCCRGTGFGQPPKVGTMSRRLSGIRFAYRMRDLPDPTALPRVIAVWEGIRRTHGAPPQTPEPGRPAGGRVKRQESDSG